MDASGCSTWRRYPGRTNHNSQRTTVVLQMPPPPILCTGFAGSVAAAASHLFEFSEGTKDTTGTDEDEDEDEDDDNDDDDIDMIKGDTAGEDDDKSDEEKPPIYEENDHHNVPSCTLGAPFLTLVDESTTVPGVFLVGPTVTQGTPCPFLLCTTSVNNVPSWHRSSMRG